MFNIFECRNANRLLWDYTARRLPEAELESVERHIRRCPSCRAQAEQYHRAVHLLDAYKDWPEPASRATWADLRNRLVRERFAPVPAVSTNRRRMPILAWSGVAGAAGAVMLGALLFNGLWHGVDQGDTHIASPVYKGGVRTAVQIPGTTHSLSNNTKSVANNAPLSGSEPDPGDLYRPDPEMLRNMHEVNYTAVPKDRARDSVRSIEAINTNRPPSGPIGPTKPSLQHKTGTLQLVNDASIDGDPLTAHAPQAGAPSTPHYVMGHIPAGTLDVQTVSYGEGSEDTHAW